MNPQPAQDGQALRPDTLDLHKMIDELHNAITACVHAAHLSRSSCHQDIHRQLGRAAFSNAHQVLAKYETLFDLATAEIS